MKFKHLSIFTLLIVSCAQNVSSGFDNVLITSGFYRYLSTPSCDDCGNNLYSFSLDLRLLQWQKSNSKIEIGVKIGHYEVSLLERWGKLDSNTQSFCLKRSLKTSDSEDITYILYDINDIRNKKFDYLIDDSTKFVQYSYIQEDAIDFVSFDYDDGDLQYSLGIVTISDFSYVDISNLIISTDYQFNSKIHYHKYNDVVGFNLCV